MNNINCPVIAGNGRADDGAAGKSASREATLATRLRRLPAVATGSVMAAALLLGASACGSSGTAPAASGPTGAVQTTIPATPGVSGVPTPSAPAGGTSAAATSPSSAATGTTDSAQWPTYTSPSGKISFEYPSEWSIAAVPGSGGTERVSVDVKGADGLIVATLDYGPSNAGLGGACQNAVPYSVLDSVELALPYNKAAADTITPRFVFRALEEPGRVTASYGVTSSVAGTGGKACMFYNVVSGPAESPFYYFTDAVQVNSGGTVPKANHKGAKTFPTMDAAKAYMQTPEYLNAKRMITSLKVHQG